MNEGEMTLDLAGTTGAAIRSTFQTCKVNRPLWSVAKICDAGYEVLYTAKGASIRRPGDTSEACTFARRNGFYIGALQQLQLKKHGGNK